MAMKQLFIFFFLSFLYYSCHDKSKSGTDIYPGEIEYLSKNDTFVRYPMFENEQYAKNEIRMRHLNITGQYIKILKRMTVENRLPDYYGGSYNNSDGVLTILVTGDTIEKKQDLAKELNGCEFIIQSCKYSYNTLMQIVDSLNIVIHRKENQMKLNNLNVDYWGLLEDKNRIVIVIDNCNPQKTKLFKKQIMDSPVFIFRSSSDSITFH